MPDPRLTRSRIPLITAVLLSLVVVGAEVVFDPSLDRERYNDNFYPHADTENYFPDFNHSQEIFIVDVFDHIANDTLNPGMGYTMSSLQGLVNRESARILIDYEGWLKGEEHMDYWDFFMEVYVPHYDLTVTTIDHLAFFDQFHQFAKGVVVYDEDNEHTINIACIKAGINGWLVAELGTARWLEEEYGLEIREDLHSGWGGSRAGVYEKAFDVLYPSCSQQMLFASIPSEWGTDYLMACKGFVFCLNPGPFTTPAEKSLMIRIMEETPADIPVIGWFEQPTGIEENYMIQLASRNGKIFLGGFRFPNKSFFTAFAPPDELRNPIRSDYYDDSGNGTGYPDIDPVVAPPPAGSTQSNTSSSSNTTSTADTLPLPPDTGNNIYIALAITDGDNLGFMTRKMRKEMWNSEIRGTIPMAWSVNPLIKEIIPCLLDYYYSTPTENDTFVAGPSGIGYFNPDFCSEEQLDIWLDRTEYGMEALDLRQVWLLNSFTTYETYYSDRVLSSYTRELQPDGMMLDYGDVPEGRKMWMQEGDDGDNYWIDPATPVIRSMHIWGDTENFVGKLIVESHVTPDDQPIFAFAPIMSADLTLESIPDLIDDLEKYDWALGRDVEFVSIDDLFYLMERHFVERARMEQEEKHTFRTVLPNWRDSGFYRMDLLRRDTAHIRSDDDPTSPEQLRKFRHYSANQAYSVIDVGKQTQDMNLEYMWSIILFFLLLVIFLRSMTRITIDPASGKKICAFNIRPSIRKAMGISQGSNQSPTMLYNGLLLIMTMLILFMTSLHVLYLNFWHYAYFGVGILGVLVVPRFLTFINRKWGNIVFSGSDADGGEMKGGGNIWIDSIQHKDLAITGALLVLTVVMLPFGSFTFSIIPFLCVRLFRRSSDVLRKSTLGWLLISLLVVVITSLGLRGYSFPVVSIVLIWFGAGVWGTIDRSGLPVPGEPGEKGSRNIVEMSGKESRIEHVVPSDLIPAPLFTALLLTMFIVIIDIPFNRYLSMATDYRMDYLPWRSLLLWVPLNSSMVGFLLLRSIRKRKLGDWTLEIATLGLIAVSGLLLVQPFIVPGHFMIPYLLTLFGSMVVLGLLGLASGTYCWQWTGRGKRLATWVQPRFFEVLVILLILGLVIVTLPPIAFTVYVVSVPIFLAYIMYSLPAVLLLISTVLMVLSRQITLQSKPLLEP